jgi:Ca2+/Na+ antiporter
MSVVIYGFNFLSGFLGVFYYFWFMYYSLKYKEIEGEKVDEELGIEHLEKEEVPILKGILFLLTGGLLIILFSNPFITSVVKIASLLQINPILLAFFLAPIASEAPEILESISLSRKGNAQNINIAYSNLVGGTITKTTFLCGIFCFFGIIKDFTWESSYSLSLTLLSICAGSASAIGVFFDQQTKWHGILLFILFIITGSIQYMTNIHVNGEIYTNEGFSHKIN